MGYPEILHRRDCRSLLLSPLVSACTSALLRLAQKLSLHRPVVSSRSAREVRCGCFLCSSICLVFVYPYTLITFPAQPSEPLAPAIEAVSSTENAPIVAKLVVCVCVFACCALDT